MFIVLLVLAIGLTCGSFVTCASYRIPLGQDIVRKPSYCPKCDTKLGFLDLWPVLSWLLSGEKCRHCKAPVSARYPLTEIVTAGLFLLVYWRYGITLQGILLWVLAVALMIMVVVDFEHYIIPDPITYFLLALGAAYHYSIGTVAQDALLGYAVGGAIGMTLHYGYRFIRKKEGLGFGDVKFLGVAGLWLTLMPIVPFLFFSGVFGVVTGLLWRAIGKGEIFPFGPSLAASLFLCIVFPDIPNMFWNIGNIVHYTQ